MVSEQGKKKRKMGFAVSSERRGIERKTGRAQHNKHTQTHTKKSGNGRTIGMVTVSQLGGNKVHEQGRKRGGNMVVYAGKRVRIAKAAKDVNKNSACHGQWNPIKKDHDATIIFAKKSVRDARRHDGREANKRRGLDGCITFKIFVGSVSVMRL